MLKNRGLNGCGRTGVATVVDDGGSVAGSVLGSKSTDTKIITQFRILVAIAFLTHRVVSIRFLPVSGSVVGSLAGCLLLPSGAMNVEITLVE